MLKRTVNNLFFLVLVATGFSAQAECPNAQGLSKMTSNVCWSCMLPVTVFGKVSFSDKNSNYEPDDITDKPLCSCDRDGVRKPGNTIGAWFPQYLVEVTTEPYCISSLEGTNLDEDSIFRGTTGEPKDRWSDQGVFMHFHLIYFPLMHMLNIVVDSTCTGDMLDMDIGWMSELDPVWTDSALSIMKSPELILYSNPITVASCASDALARIFHQTTQAARKPDI